jgi:hypothetical protein
MTQPYAAGAIESTVDDLAKWTAALADGRAVDPKLLKRAWTPYQTTSQPSDYGYGWFVRSESGETWIGHNGGINGFTSAAVWIPEKRVFVAVLRNALGGPAPAPETLLRRLALEAVGRPESKRTAVTLAPETLEKYVGVYAVSPEMKFTVILDDAKLYVVAPDKKKLELFAEAEGKFFTKDIDAQFVFAVENGRATQLTVHRAGRARTAQREQ